MPLKGIGIVFLFTMFIFSLSGCNEEPQPVKVEKPALPVFNPVLAQKRATNRISTVPMAVAPIAEKTDYIRLVAKETLAQRAPTGFLSGLTSHQSKTVVILAHIENGENLKLPAVPLFIFEKHSADWTTTFQAVGSLSPLFVAQRAALSMSLEMVLLNTHLEDLDKDARKILQAYSGNLTLYSKGGAHQISALADDFQRRIALGEEASFDEVAHFTVSYLENDGNTLNLLSATGENNLSLQLAIKGKTTMLPLHQKSPAPYDELLTHKIGLKSPREALGDLETGFWSVPGNVLRPSCQAIRGALKERLGLSERDSALILWRMMQPHAIFAQGIDYTKQCSGEDLSVLLNEMGFSLPATRPTRASSKTQSTMNKTLSKVARLIKSAKDKNEEKVANLLADTVLIRDQARLLFSETPEQVIENSKEILSPSADKDFTAQYLMSLPIRAYGCYSKGQGQIGNHRASLITLENDPNLWMMDFAFNKDNKINGLNFRAVTQKDFCISIGARKGSNRCTFSDKDFPGLSSKKCG